MRLTVLTEWFVGLATFVSCSIALWSVPTVRLVDRNGPNHFQGRVEVLYEGGGVSGWFTVCDDNWDYRDAAVVCRQLGFSGLTAPYYGGYFGAGSGPIAMDEIRCTGRERRLQDCQFDGWFKHNCKHTEDAGVRCRVHEPASRRMIPVRLVNGNSDADGIVEIQYKGGRGAISSQRFSEESARVICGQLGYPQGEIGTRATAECAVYEGSIIARGFICTGRETSLSRCSLMFWGPFDENRIKYNASELAYVRCFPPHANACTVPTVPTSLPLRLRGGRGPWEGRVEILNLGNRHDNSWSPLCDHDWSQYTANVVCRHLGYGTASRVYGSSYFGRGVGFTYNYVFECNGHELTLSQCNHEHVGWYSCKHYQEAGVECHRPRKVADTVRISGAGTYTGGYSGFLEVKVDEHNQWYKVCDESWGLTQARVVCRELDLGFGKLGSLRASRRHPNVTYVNVRHQCTGDEFQLSDCITKILTLEKTIGFNATSEEDTAEQGNRTDKPNEAGSCDSGFAWVECSPDLPDLVPDVEELRRSLHAYPHVVTLGSMPCALEEGCFSPSARKYSGSYDHKRVLLRFTTRVLNLGRAPFMPHQPREHWKWHSCHQHYHSFESFSVYHLIDRNGRQVGHGHKAGFCLEDRDCEERGPSPLVYYNCRGGHGGRQGISVNCADTYRRTLDCQWVDLTDIPYGRYRLVIDVNPHRRVAETDFSNNAIYCYFSYISQWWPVVLDGCGVYPNWKQNQCNQTAVDTEANG